MADCEDTSDGSNSSNSHSDSDSSESEDQIDEQSTSKSRTDQSRPNPDAQSDLPAILNGKYFEIAKKISGMKILAKCKLCPNKLLSAQINCTSNLLKHLKVSLR